VAIMHMVSNIYYVWQSGSLLDEVQGGKLLLIFYWIKTRWMEGRGGLMFTCQ
jgi:hypothetical protein